MPRGLSPRVRGKRHQLTPDDLLERSIPACAGETASSANHSLAAKVYPRVCGGNGHSPLVPGYGGGLSPRVRGKLVRWYFIEAKRRSIPACAGETPDPGRPAGRGQVYPRVCGGNHARNTSPAVSRGLSPRVRGKRRRPVRKGGAARSIPACAGETTRGIGIWPRRPVYPRVCGGNWTRLNPSTRGTGLSPRVRGKPAPPPEGGRRIGSIPACAGETAVSRFPYDSRAVYPRVCGGNIMTVHSFSSAQGLSPRVRGKRRIPRRPAAPERSIPACAGETDPAYRPERA